MFLKPDGFNRTSMFFFRWLVGQTLVLVVFGYIIVKLVGEFASRPYPNQIRYLASYDITLLFVVLPLMFGALAMVQKWAIKMYSNQDYDGWITATVMGSFVGAVWVMQMGNVLSLIFPENMEVSPWLTAAFYIPLNWFPVIEQVRLMRRYLKKSTSTSTYTSSGLIASFAISLVIVVHSLLNDGIYLALGSQIFFLAYIMVSIFESDNIERGSGYM